MGAVTAPDSEVSNSEDAGGSAEAWRTRSQGCDGVARQCGSPGEAPDPA